jgi:hypothetical protein
MSTSAISSLSIQHKLDAYIRVRHQDLDKLGQALQSGDLASAQKDYADIQSLGQKGPLPNGDPFLNSNREQDFEAIGSALQSGDLAAASQAFGQLASTFGRVVPPIVSQPSPVGPSPADPASSEVSNTRSLSVNA